MDFQFNYKSYESINDLPEEGKKLLLAAEDQLDYAYAPYSEFHVGAALLLSNGDIVTGCNQENAAYPLCMCAERVALYNLGSSYKTFTIVALAITAYNKRKELTEPCMPCGACRQVIAEFEQRQDTPITLYMSSKRNYCISVEGINELLPAVFSKKHLI